MAVSKRFGDFVFVLLSENPDATSWSKVQWQSQLDELEKVAKKERKDNKEANRGAPTLSDVDKELKKKEDADRRAETKRILNANQTSEQKRDAAEEKVAAIKKKFDALSEEEKESLAINKSEQIAKQKAARDAKTREKEELMTPNTRGVYDVLKKKNPLKELKKMLQKKKSEKKEENPN